MKNENYAFKAFVILWGFAFVFDKFSETGLL